jgi:hypothetical protein
VQGRPEVVVPLSVSPHTSFPVFHRAGIYIGGTAGKWRVERWRVDNFHPFQMETTGNVSRLAKEIGISRPTFRKYRAEGMPTGSAEAARVWVAHRKASEARGGNQGGGRKAPGAAASGERFALRDSLLRAQIAKTEEEAKLKAFEVEAAQKNLVSMDTARSYVAGVLAPLRTLLDALPQSCGPRANPSDPALGEQAIREALDGIFKAMDKARPAGDAPAAAPEAPQNVA